MTVSYSSLLLPLLGYLAGTIPTGLIIGFAMGTDIRSNGSGNIGATNVARVIGKKWGVITLAADVLKGYLPVLLAMYITSGQSDAAMIVGLTGFGAVAGHCFSVFLKFRGGKGVATAVGVFLAVSPLSVAGAFVIFFAAMKKWGIVSVASLLSALTVLPLMHIISPGVHVEIMAWAIAAVIWFKHLENIKRLLEGKESRFRNGGDNTDGGDPGDINRE